MITRFAPSPTGLLHLGHAFSALTAFSMARRAKGTFLLRIEDIDTTRCTPEFERQIFRDLSWLGLEWPEPVMRQSERQPVYDSALKSLKDRGLIYACTCTRADIRTALSAPQEGPHGTPLDASAYPGTCRDKARPLRGAALRLNMKRALAQTGPITFTEHGDQHAGHHQFSVDMLLKTHGDIVLARRDLGTSYHLSVCIDDAHQCVTDVVRGVDLFAATALHIVLQRLLDLPTPRYHHHRLIRDEQGKRLAKRDDARALAHYRQMGKSPLEIRTMLGLDGN
jgi:glutamyl-Q tRNA(Asp) synthetase